mgnify:FL=1
MAKVKEFITGSINESRKTAKDVSQIFSRVFTLWLSAIILNCMIVLITAGGIELFLFCGNHLFQSEKIFHTIFANIFPQFLFVVGILSCLIYDAICMVKVYVVYKQARQYAQEELKFMAMSKFSKEYTHTLG